MGDDAADTASDDTEADGALTEFAPWRQAGWIFRDGDSIALERRGDVLRTRILAD
ncbi:MAG TPA: hypothetical protein VH012_09095 [Acidimicrobiales bacterium]|jgi:hypothetical protein|nr:hypothetical protein [Acidimicrobiales bacterium]